jgi:hypothetical protein
VGGCTRSCSRSRRRGIDRSPARRDRSSVLRAQRCSLGQVVGSSTGAVIRRDLLVCFRRFHLRARLGDSVIPFPAPVIRQNPSRL